MMIVITMSCCPQKLRGDLTRWFVEIDTGVYVGNLTARVRDAVWERICANIGSGRATMVYSAHNEQKLEFRIHHAVWEPIDYDGIKLVRRNYPAHDDDEYRKHSKAAIQHMLHNKKQIAPQSNTDSESKYVVIDIETTGLQNTDSIIELGAIVIANGEPEKSFSVLVQCEKPVPSAVTELTGITTEQLLSDGIPLKAALSEFLSLIGSLEIVGYNIDFDMKFINQACKENGFSEIRNKGTDVQKLARKRLKQCMRFTLSAVAEYLEIEYEQRHRVLADCTLTYRIFEKLKEM